MPHIPSSSTLRETSLLLLLLWCHVVRHSVVDERAAAAKVRRDEQHEWRPPLLPEEGAVAGLPGARYVGRALPAAYAARLADRVRIARTPLRVNGW